MDRDDLMRAAIAEARAGMALGQSPFGSVIARAGVIVGRGHNEVVRRTDPTAHAEIIALRHAAAKLGTFDLSGCVLYTTCEPCPMCAAAAHWARVGEVVFGASIADAAGAGFNELRVSVADLYRIGASGVKLTPGVLSTECAALFRQWAASPGAVAY